MASKKQKLSVEGVVEQNENVKGINSLPDEIVLQIFHYLPQNNLGQIARVCKRWNVLTESPDLWKKVDVKLYYSANAQKLTKLINRLLPCTTRIKLQFRPRGSYLQELIFKEVCIKLQEKCPQLEMLFLQQIYFLDNLSSIIDLCTKNLKNLKVLVFHHSIFSDSVVRGKQDGVSKIKVLDITWCHFDNFRKPPFSRMPCLKKLYLRNGNEEYCWLKVNTSFLNQLEVLTLESTIIDFVTFRKIWKHGQNLKELYFCGSVLKHEDFNFGHDVFPNLETICLNICFRITCEGIVSLIQSCHSLQNVYVCKEVARSYAEHPFVTANRCKFGIVKVVFCSDHKKEDYSYE